ncbi:lysosomal Pro-X carboxypeptidase-like [Mytilus edulis]|uniref:lysosomal Pro-X carboxypeptidase-like n=1 Tax=Mytilus edulis TaxID=6550 RepID=UPI0039EFB255
MPAKLILLFLIIFIVFSENEGFRFKHMKNNYLKSNNSNSGYFYKTLYFKQKVDHFGFINNDEFQQRYLVYGGFRPTQDGGPVFFYTGNEGDITWFCNNTGFMWELAKELKAMVIFGEHRYYGQSLPYGKESFKDPTKLQYLTSEQALADFAVFIDYLRSDWYPGQKVPVIAFGGSYGGMLSAWFRMKYPHSIQGALAASAPIWQFTDLVDCGAFLKTVTNTFKHHNPKCADNIRNSWMTINKVATTETGRKTISDTFRLCKPLQSIEDVGTFKAWLQETWVDLAMVDYPYPSNFLEPLPAWPIKEVCSYLSKPLTTDVTLLQSVYQAVNMYYNYTGKASCLDINQEATQDLGTMGWDYQACTEMVMPTCSNGKDDMFEPVEWNFDAYSKQCQKQWSVTPRPMWPIIQYGGKNITTASNIIFSNGLLDPWSSGGVTESLSASLPAIIIPDGAHHLDLRSTNKNDPKDVTQAREKEKDIITQWIKDFYN